MMFQSVRCSTNVTFLRCVIDDDEDGDSDDGADNSAQRSGDSGASSPKVHNFYASTIVIGFLLL